MLNLQTQNALGSDLGPWRNCQMAGRPGKSPDLSKAGGRVAWCRRKLKPPMSQDQLAEELGYGTQSGVGNLERKDSIPPKVAKKAAAFFRQRLQLNVTTDWLHHGGPEPKPLYATSRTDLEEPSITFTLDQRVAALPEALREYVIQSLALAEQVRGLIPEKFLIPPTGKTYQEFHDYLTKLSSNLPQRGTTRG